MKKGFTFLEVMFGLSIVGIISAMVIPIFYNSYHDRVRGTQLKKICGQISYAIESIIADEKGKDDIDYGDVSSDSESEENTSEETSSEETSSEESSEPSSETSSEESSETTEETTPTTVSNGFYLTSAGVKTSNATQGAQYFLNKYFTHTKVNCGPGGSNTCIPLTYRSPKKTVLGTIPNSYYCIKTTNSASICMRYDEDHHVTRVVVDINGQEKPNISGSDLFVMYITEDGQLQDIDDDESHCNEERTEGVTAENYAAGCFTKVVTNGWKMRK